MAKKKTISEQLVKLNKGTRRELAVKEGAYDGRFRPKVFEDKSKKSDKYKCRDKNQTED